MQSNYISYLRYSRNSYTWSFWTRNVEKLPSFEFIIFKVNHKMLLLYQTAFLFTYQRHRYVRKVWVIIRILVNIFSLSWILKPCLGFSKYINSFEIKHEGTLNQQYIIFELMCKKPDTQAIEKLISAFMRISRNVGNFRYIH